MFWTKIENLKDEVKRCKLQCKELNEEIDEKIEQIDVLEEKLEKINAITKEYYDLYNKG